MLGFHERRKLKRYIYSRLSLALLLALVIMLGWSVWGIYGKAKETSIKRAALALERDELQARAGELGEEIQRLGTDRGIEAELRNRFEVGQPGEKVIVVVDPEVPPAEELPKEPKSLWEWLKEWFD